MSSQRLQGKTAIVTGGAQGIGNALARRLAAEGARVLIADLQRDSGEKAVERLCQAGLDARFREADLRDDKSVRDMVDSAVEWTGRLDILVNNARPRLRVGTMAETIDEWDLAMDVILKAAAVAAVRALPHLVDSKGTIVNMISTNAYFVSHQPAAYHVAKAGLVHLTRYLAGEYGPQGVRVNAICPALVDVIDRTPVTRDPVNKAVSELAVPLKRACHPEEIADALLFLSTDASSYMTGQVLMLDGGLSLFDQFHVGREAYRASAKSSADA